MKVLVAGITGFVGRELLPVLLAAGHQVVGVSRKPAVNTLGVPVLQCDIAAGGDLARALDGIDVAYYLVHSIEQHNAEGFAVRDRRAAELFGRAAERASVRRIVYCGVSPAAGSTTPTAHRHSRSEVGSILQSAVPESVCLRTWTILSPTNQFIRFLIYLLRQQRLVALPPSARFRSPPIDGRDLALALAAAAHTPELAGRTVDVVGKTVINNVELVEGLSDKLGLRRRIVRLPFRPPKQLLTGLIRAARLDATLVQTALSSAEVGDVLPEQNFLEALVPSPHGLDASLAYAVGSNGSGV